MYCQFITIFTLCTFVSAKKPHIIFILADDLGWNDVGFNGLNEISTPNIDALAYSGIILNNYYVTPICTPSRSALMTGKYPIRNGMQHGVLYGAEPRGLPLNEKILPEYLQELGYENHIVGKWHLGFYTKEYTPTYRGFKSHLGYWTGHQDYYDHTAHENFQWGLDMRENLSIAYHLHGQYSTEIFSNEAIRIIKHHNESLPLFLYVGHVAVHSGNPYNPLPAPDEEVKKFDYIPNYNRRRFAAMLKKMDDSVGQIVMALNEKNMLKDSVIVFSSDNGGPAAGFNLNAASNWPLRGVKNTLWEGGIKGAALLWSPFLNKTSRVAKQLMHISDWLPTLLNIATGNHWEVKDVDGLDLWTELSEDLPSKRTEILHNIDDIYGNAALMVGPWKLVQGNTYNGQWDGWYGPAGRNYTYQMDALLKSPTYIALTTLNKNPLPKQIGELRQMTQLNCTSQDSIACEPADKACLFNILLDPCENKNMADEHPNILKNLKNRLDEYNATAIPPANLPLDPRGFPQYWNYVWTNFGDYI